MKQYLHISISRVQADLLSLNGSALKYYSLMVLYAY